MPRHSTLAGFAFLASGTLAVALVAAGCSGKELPSEGAAPGSISVDGPLYSAQTTNGPRKIALLDDCSPGSVWNGGCSLPGGSVTIQQFQADLPKGHASWRNEPSYLKISSGKGVKISNEGGRPHTFTRVAAYGAGIVPPLNWPGESIAPECLNSATRLASLLAGGESMVLEDLEPGVHKFMCCFHPWMVGEIRVL